MSKNWLGGAFLFPSLSPEHASEGPRHAALLTLSPSPAVVEMKGE
jgi:hypothetical protein